MTKDYYEPPMNVYSAMRGTLIHQILENADDEGLTELTTERQIEGTDTVLRGTIDRYFDGVIYDYKTMVDTGFNMIGKQGPKEAHIWQANIYKWMLEPQYPVNDIKIIYVGLANVAVTGENLTFDKWGKTVTWDLPPCPVYTSKRVYDYLKAKIDIIERSANPPADSSEAWLCKICPFHDECLNDPKEADEEPF